MSIPYKHQFFFKLFKKEERKPFSFWKRFFIKPADEQIYSINAGFGRSWKLGPSSKKSSNEADKNHYG